MNYYLAKSDPNHFRLQDYLNTCSAEQQWEDSWAVCKDAKPGDTLFIGLSGTEAGIYAKAVITSIPTFTGCDPEFWINPEEAKKPRYIADIEFSQNLIRCPILEQNLMAISELKRMSELLHRRGAACHLREEEAEAIDGLMSAS